MNKDKRGATLQDEFDVSTDSEPILPKNFFTSWITSRVGRGNGVFGSGTFYNLLF